MSGSHAQTFEECLSSDLFSISLVVLIMSALRVRTARSDDSHSRAVGRLPVLIAVLPGGFASSQCNLFVSRITVIDKDTSEHESSEGQSYS